MEDVANIPKSDYHQFPSISDILRLIVMDLRNFFPILVSIKHLGLVRFHEGFSNNFLSEKVAQTLSFLDKESKMAKYHLLERDIYIS